MKPSSFRRSLLFLEGGLLSRVQNHFLSFAHGVRTALLFHVEVDANRTTVTRRWSTGACKQPVSMAIDTGHHRLFSGCRSGVMAVSDYQAGKAVATVPIGTGVDGAGYDAASANAFASNADGTLTVIHQDSPDQYRVIQTLQTPQGSRNMGLDPTNHRVFVVSARFGTAPGRGRPPVLPGTFSLMVIEP